MKTFKILLSAALVSATFGTGAMASSKSIPDETKARVTQKLTGEGYEVRKIKSEKGMIEVYVLKDGRKLELYLDDQLNIVKGGDSDD